MTSASLQKWGRAGNSLKGAFRESSGLGCAGSEGLEGGAAESPAEGWKHWTGVLEGRRERAFI